jgi:hypothetical protein
MLLRNACSRLPEYRCGNPEAANAELCVCKGSVSARFAYVTAPRQELGSSPETNKVPPRTLPRAGQLPDPLCMQTAHPSSGPADEEGASSEILHIRH